LKLFHPSWIVVRVIFYKVRQVFLNALYLNLPRRLLFLSSQFEKSLNDYPQILVCSHVLLVRCGVCLVDFTCFNGFFMISIEMKISDKTIVIILLIIKLLSLRRTVASANRRFGEPSLLQTYSFFMSQYFKKLAAPQFSKKIVSDVWFCLTTTYIVLYWSYNYPKRSFF